MNGSNDKNEQTEFTIGEYNFNYKLRILDYKGNGQRLSPKEAELLRLLALHLNDVLSREVALKTIWSEDNYFTARSMDVFVTRIRKYFKFDPDIEIVNVHGNGFRLTVNRK